MTSLYVFQEKFKTLIWRYVVFLYGLLVNYNFYYYNCYYYYYYSESESAFFIAKKKCLISTAINFAKSRSAVRSEAVIAKAAKIKMKKKLDQKYHQKAVSEALSNKPLVGLFNI